MDHSEVSLLGEYVPLLGFALLFDTVSGGPANRPKWITQSTTYPLLNATSASIADFVDRRRKGEPVFGDEHDNGAAAIETNSTR